MLSSEYSFGANQKQGQKSLRKPLQPKNLWANQTVNRQIKAKPHPGWMEISLIGDSDKENRPINEKPATFDLLDSSLAEELNAIRKKLDRLRLDRDRTEKMLKERDAVLEFQIKGLDERGEVQKNLEIQVDILYRLQQLKSSCTKKISPLRSLRETEREQKIEEARSRGVEDVYKDDLVDEGI